LSFSKYKNDARPLELNSICNGQKEGVSEKILNKKFGKNEKFLGTKE